MYNNWWNGVFTVRLNSNLPYLIVCTAIVSLISVTESIMTSCTPHDFTSKMSSQVCVDAKPTNRSWYRANAECGSYGENWYRSRALQRWRTFDNYWITTLLISQTDSLWTHTDHSTGQTINWHGSLAKNLHSYLIQIKWKSLFITHLLMSGSLFHLFPATKSWFQHF